MYKRQEHDLLNGGGATAEEKAMLDRELEAVSYTHLDVYKRQQDRRQHE